VKTVALYSKAVRYDQNNFQAIQTAARSTKALKVEGPQKQQKLSVGVVRSR